MFKSKKLAVLAALLSLLMLVSLLTVPAFAEEVTTGAETTVDTSEVTTEEVTTGEPTTDADTNEETTEAGTKEDSTGAETKAEETTTGANKDTAKDDEDKKDFLIRSIVNIAVGVIILVGLGIAAYKNRAKIPSWWKGLKSECGKITWCPKDKLKKNVLVVVVIILAIAFAIAVLDFVFSTSMVFLKNLFN